MKRILNLFVMLVILAVLGPLGAVASQTTPIGSTTTNLGASAVYTSDIVASQGWDNIRGILVSNENGTLLVEQSSKDSCQVEANFTADYTSTFAYTAGSANNGYYVSVVGKCVRFKFTNTGASTTTSLLLNFYLYKY